MLKISGDPGGCSMCPLPSTKNWTCPITGTPIRNYCNSETPYPPNCPALESEKETVENEILWQWETL